MTSSVQPTKVDSSSSSSLSLPFMIPSSYPSSSITTLKWRICVTRCHKCQSPAFSATEGSIIHFICINSHRFCHTSDMTCNQCVSPTFDNVTVPIYDCKIYYNVTNYKNAVQMYNEWVTSLGHTVIQQENSSSSSTRNDEIKSPTFPIEIISIKSIGTHFSHVIINITTPVHILLTSFHLSGLMSFDHEPISTTSVIDPSKCFTTTTATFETSDDNIHSFVDINIELKTSSSQSLLTGARFSRDNVDGYQDCYPEHGIAIVSSRFI